MTAARTLPPRETMALEALLSAGSLTRAELDRAACCLHSPDAVYQLRHRWHVEIDKVYTGRMMADGRVIRTALYALTGHGRAVARALLDGREPPPKAQQGDLFGGADAG